MWRPSGEGHYLDMEATEVPRETQLLPQPLYDRDTSAYEVATTRTSGCILSGGVTKKQCLADFPFTFYLRRHTGLDFSQTTHFVRGL